MHRHYFIKAYLHNLKIKWQDISFLQAAMVLYLEGSLSPSHGHPPKWWTSHTCARSKRRTSAAVFVYFSGGPAAAYIAEILSTFGGAVLVVISSRNHSLMSAMNFSACFLSLFYATFWSKSFHIQQGRVPQIVNKTLLYALGYQREEVLSGCLFRVCWPLFFWLTGRLGGLFVLCWKSKLDHPSCEML